MWFVCRWFALALNATALKASGSISLKVTGFWAPVNAAESPKIDTSLKAETGRKLPASRTMLQNSNL